MTLTDPFWLVLAIPAAMLLWLCPLPSRLMSSLRAVALAAVVLALCGLAISLPIRSGTVVLVADRSFSMPEGATAQQKEAADLIHAAMESGNQLAVVSFAEKAAVERSPESGKFSGFSVEVGGEASNLADAIDLGLSLVDRGRPGRILILSDGRWTGRDPAASAARAAASGVALDYRPQQRSAAGDLAVERIQGPESVMPGESFMMTAWIESPVAQTISYELSRGATVIAGGTQAVPSGASRMIFRDTAGASGASEYTLRVRAQEKDPVPGNNVARLLVGVRGAKPVLCVSPAKAGGLPRLLSAGGVKIDARQPSELRWTLEEMAGYSAVLLENTSANLIGGTGMENLASWVSKSGGGLMLTGGRDSYGPGGYYKSPLEPIMPVSMELRREHRKLSLAIVVALDRSGSMACPVPDGRPKMQLADLATAEVLDMLGPMDQFGCIAVDSTPHEIVPFSDVSDAAGMRDKILRIDSMGGGIYIYEALVASANMIRGAKAGTRHIILFADAADSEHPEDYAKVVDALARAGITVSVIGLGTDHDCDANLLRDIARRGRGQCMFTNSAQELPRLFAQDTFMIARNAFLDEPVAVRDTGGLLSITRQPLGDFPKIGGYNLCYLRPEANMAVVSKDEYKAPVLASWHAGLGRVLCYTGEADGRNTGAIAKWPRAGDFFTSLARWTAGKSQGLGKDVLVTQELRNGVCRVEAHLDPERETTPFGRLPELTTLSAHPGEKAVARKTRMNWSSADTLLAEIPLAGGETLLTTVEAAGLGHVTLSPMCLPYSPEYQPAKPGRGVASLEHLARATGGCERLDLPSVWKDIPRKPRFILLAPYLLLGAVAIFLIEVIQRRTGIFTIRRLPAIPASVSSLFSRMQTVRPAKKSASAAAKRIEPKAETRTAEKPAAEPPAAPPKSEVSSEDGISNALNQAQQRAKRRTGGN